MADNQSKNIDELIAKLSSEDDEAREEAASSLVGVIDKRLVPLLVEKMSSDPNPGVKYFAKKALAAIQKELGDLKAILAETKRAAPEDRPAEHAAAKEEPPAETAPGPPAVQPPSRQQSVSKGSGGPGAGVEDKAEIAGILEIVKAGDRNAVAALAGRMAGEKNPYILATLISAVGRLGDGSRMDSLLPFLSHGDHRVVANCVEALERLGDSRCVDYLGGLLTHPDGRVRSNAVKAIWKFTDKSLAINQGAFEKIRELAVSDNREMRESAIYILGEIADDEAIELLNEAASDPDEKVRTRAADAVKKALRLRSERMPAAAPDDGETSYPKSILSDPETAREIDEKSKVEIKRILGMIQNSDKLGALKLVEKLDYEQNPYVKASMISAIGRLGNRSDMENLLPCLADEDTRIVANTVEALENIGNPRCVAHLVKIITHPDNRVRANVIKAIWKYAHVNVLANKVIIEKLREMLNSPRAEMRESAIFVLGEIEDDASVELLNTVVADRDENIKKKAIGAVEKIVAAVSEREASEASSESLMIKTAAEVAAMAPGEKKTPKQLREEEAAAKAKAEKPKEMDEATKAEVARIQKTIDSGDKNILPGMLERLGREKNPFIKATLLAAVGKFGSKNEMDQIVPFLSDDDTRVIANAVEALETINNPKCVEHVIKLISHADNRVRANVVKAIWKFAHTNIMANRLIIDRLKEMMFSSKNLMRESAIFALGEIANDEALELLTIASNDKNQQIKEKAVETLEKARKKHEETAAETAGKRPGASVKTSPALKKAEEQTDSPAAPVAARPKTPPAIIGPITTAASGSPRSPVKAAIIIAAVMFTLLFGSGIYYWYGYKGFDTVALVGLIRGEWPIDYSAINDVPETTSAKDPSGKSGSNPPPLPKQSEAAVFADNLEMCRKYSKEGFFSEAIARLTDMLNRQPNNAEVKQILTESSYKRADALFNLEIYDSARTEFEKVIQMDGKDGAFGSKAQGKLEKIAKLSKKQ